MNRFFTRRYSFYSWVDYWIKGHGDGFMKLPLLIIGLGTIGFVIATIIMLLCH